MTDYRQKFVSAERRQVRVGYDPATLVDLDVGPDGVMRAGPLALTADGVADAAISLGNLGAPLSPARWAQRRDPRNPVIDYTMDPAEAASPQGTSYVPAPVLVGDDIIVYVKTDHSEVVRCWRVPDRGAGTPVLLGTAIPKGASWDDRQTAESAAWHDEQTGVIHLFYKGRNQASGKWGVGYATAPASDPVSATKHGGNPVITSAGVEAALGLAAGSVMDVGVTDFARDAAGLWHVFGFVATDTNAYRIVRWTGASLTSLTLQGVLVEAPPQAAGGAPFGLAALPTVFRHPTAPWWVMIYVEGMQRDGAEISYPRVALSQDLVTWERTDEFLTLPLDTVEVRFHTVSILKGGPDNASPLLIRGEYQLWHSLSPNAHDVTGILYLQPTASRDGKRRPALEVYTRTAQSIPNGANIDSGWTPVQWGTRVIESPRGWMHYHMEKPENPEAAFGEEWTCRAAGRYRIEAHLGDGFAPNATGHRGLQVLRGDGTVATHSIVPSNGGTLRTPVQVSATVDLQEGEIITIRAWQNSGGALSTSAYFAYPRLMISRVD